VNTPSGECPARLFGKKEGHYDTYQFQHFAARSTGIGLLCSHIAFLHRANIAHGSNTG
jgi:hypothetical protein